MSDTEHMNNSMGYCIVRSHDQGVMCGFVESINGRTVILHEARQIWKYDSWFVLADVAELGMRDPSKAMLSVAMSKPMIMLEACGIYVCSNYAKEQLRNIPAQRKESIK